MTKRQITVLKKGLRMGKISPYSHSYSSTAEPLWIGPLPPPSKK